MPWLAVRGRALLAEESEPAVPNVTSLVVAWDVSTGSEPVLDVALAIAGLPLIIRAPEGMERVVCPSGEEITIVSPLVAGGEVEDPPPPQPPQTREIIVATPTIEQVPRPTAHFSYIRCALVKR